jgi:thymidylate synthase (FAD)
MDPINLRVIREPRVTLLARQQFVYPEHIQWQSDSDVPGEVVAEFAGRLCFDAATQVLTREGWRYFKDVGETHEVLTKNPRSGKAEFQRPIATHRYPYRGDLWTAEGRDISLAVTPEHRQWGRFRDASLRLKDYTFVRTDEIGNRIFAIDGAADGWSGAYPDDVELPAVEYSQVLANASGVNGSRSTTIAARTIAGREQIVALAHLCAFYATEGSTRHQRGSGQGIVIYGDHVASVVQLCQVLDLPHSVWTDPRNGVERVLIGGGIQWRTFFEQECGSGSPNKRLPGWVLNLPSDDLREIWRILVRTDGHTYASGRETIITTSEELAGQCQEILCKTGFKSSVTRQSSSQGTNYPTFLISRKSPKPVLLNRRVKLRQTPYEGEVFCLTVPNGTLFVRRYGKPHFSGNCYLSFGADAGLEGGHRTIAGRTTNEAYLANILRTKHGSVLEHAVWTLLLEGVSRALTHELVRHRAGMGFSQLSQRYVDESDIAFVLPPEIEEGSPAEEAWKRACGDSLAAYREILQGLTEQIGEEGTATMRKKRTRQAARSVLPNAAETKIVVTGNARSWRHFVEMRGSPTADVEIRRLAVTVLRLLQGEAPHIFADLKIVPQEDGTEIVEAEHSKV